MVKFYLPAIAQYDSERNKGELNHIIRDGINSNPNSCLVSSYDECDYVIVDFRHLNGRSGYKESIPSSWYKKLVIIDYADSTEIFKTPCVYYFKRSVVDKKNNTFIQYDKSIIPISYCIKNACLNFDTESFERDIDIAVFFRQAHENPKSGMSRRSAVASYIKSHFSDKNIWVGIAGTDGERGRMDISDHYYQTMLRSKIVVNCNPDNWEGDYRLFEALSCKTMVMSDPMITPVQNPLINEKDLIYYDSLEMLGNKIEYYLNHDLERELIAQSGYNNAIKYHKASDRIDEILGHLNR